MLKELIDKFYLEREKEKRKKDKQRIRFFISEAGKCPRMIFFRFKKAPAEEIEPERLRVFEEGEIIQQRILRHLFSLGIVRATEIQIPPQELVAGRADAIISFTDKTFSDLGVEMKEKVEAGVPYVLEIKSISGKMNLKKLPLPDHINQLQLYLHYFNIKNGILLYLNKDTQEITEFLFEYDKDLVEKILSWFSKLKEKIEADLVPIRLVDWPENWQCQKCEFSEICKIAGEKEIQWENLKKEIEKMNRLSQESV
jgi:CRISPR/Cas system-associated exonuclease Cas4 (RecB family)